MTFVIAANIRKATRADRYIVRPSKDIMRSGAHPFRKRHCNAKSSQVAIRRLAEMVAAKYGLGIRTLLSGDKSRHISHPRQVLYFLSYKRLNASLLVIGKTLHRDHTTVLYGCKSVSARLVANKALSHELDGIMELYRRAPKPKA